jgi:multidrug efflux pump subunit AcrB
VQLGDVASVTLAPEPVVVAHDAVLRHVDVVATLPSRDRGAVASEVTQRLRAMQMPFEYRAEVVDTAAPAGSGAQLWWWALAALLTVLLVIQAALRSWRRALLLVLALPLALAGALPAAGAVGGPATAGAVAGMVGVLALTVRHGLAVLNGAPSDDADDMGDRELVDAHASDGLAPDAHAGNGHVVGGEAWDGDPGEGRAGRVPDAISGARRQAFPMLVSVAAVAALFAPAAVAAGAGMEFLHPAAVVLLAGLVTAVPVTLILLPGLAVALAPASSGGAPTAPAAKAGGADRPPELVATTTAGRPQPSLEGN